MTYHKTCVYKCKQGLRVCNLVFINVIALAWGPYWRNIASCYVFVFWQIYMYSLRFPMLLERSHHCKSKNKWLQITTLYVVYNFTHVSVECLLHVKVFIPLYYVKIFRIERTVLVKQFASCFFELKGHATTPCQAGRKALVRSIHGQV